MILLHLVACGGGGGGGGGGSGGHDSTPPTASAAPVTGVRISEGARIVISFSETIDRSSLALGQAMSLDATVTWSTTSAVDDTVTLQPVTTWIEGVARALTIDAKDLAGNPLTRLSLAYDVDATPPTGSAAPASPATIGSTGQVVVVFGETMLQSSLSLAGSLAAASDGGVWSTTAVPGDTLTLSPASTWPGGVGTLEVSATDLVGHAAPRLQLEYQVDDVLPGGSPVTPNGSIVARTDALAIVFTEPMDPSSLVLGGALALEAGAPVWSATTYPDDTLTVSPLVAWGKGSARGLDVAVDDLHGNALVPLALTYDVGVVHADAAASPGGTGTSTSPYGSIQAAIDRAAAGGFGEVRVASGAYVGSLSLASGVDVRGSFGPGWAPPAGTYSPSSRVVGRASIVDAARAIAVDARDLAAPTTLAGLEIDGPPASLVPGAVDSYAVYVRAAVLTLDSVTINGGFAALGAPGTDGTDRAGTAASGLGGGGAYEANIWCDATGRGYGGAGGGAGARAGGCGGDGGTMDTTCGAFGCSNCNATAGLDGSSAAISAAAYGTGGLGGGTTLGATWGGRGADGGSGGSGTSGFGGTPGGGVVSGFFVGTGKGADGGLGGDGTGGGGGGGSGGCDAGTDSWGAGGGGGGAGGLAAASAGTGGSPGGSSFGVFAASGTLSFVSTSIRLGAGGQGGRGGAQAAGQPGGAGGMGGGASGDSGAGGDGGNGGTGGCAGPGGGGGGGSAYGVYLVVGAVRAGTPSFSGGSAGAGGLGGAALHCQTFPNAGSPGAVVTLRE
jgi:hypothetical protein